MKFEEIAAGLSATPASYLKVSRQIAQGAVEGLDSLRVGILSTYTAQFLEPYLVVECARRGFALAPWFGPWGQLDQQALDASSEFYARQPDAVVLLWRLEELLPGLAERFPSASEADKREALGLFRRRCRSLLSAIRGHSSARILAANFSLPERLAAGLGDAALDPSQTAFVEQCNVALAMECREVSDAFVFDYARLVAEHGIRNWTDPKLYHLARIPFGVGAQIATAVRLSRTLRAALKPAAKALVLDLDNTLWGGVLGEDGVGGIALGDEYPGNVYKAFQRYLLTLKDRGVLLAVATKNNPRDVEELWERHPDCVLRRADFAAVRINWDEKSANLQELAGELGVGLDSFVFFDDNPFEREEVRRRLPMVKVIDAPESPLGYIDAIEESGFFDRLVFSDEDRQRTELYRQQAERAAALERVGSAEEFLESLELTATIGPVDADTLPRVAQLLAKTNQFNLTTRRHSAADLERMIQSGATALWLRLADRFGDNGLVGAAIALPEEDGVWRIDTFLLSCRVIGRRAETALLSHLAHCVDRRGGSALMGEYIATPKNGPAAEFYPAHGFQPDGSGRWRCDLRAAPIAAPPFIRIETP